MPHLNLVYRMKGDRYFLNTDLNKEGLQEVLEIFLSMQIGQGKDLRESHKRKEYSIQIRVDLSDDTFSCKDDCGNKGLRDGILMCLLQEMENNSEKVGFI